MHEVLNILAAGLGIEQSDSQPKSLDIVGMRFGPKPMGTKAGTNFEPGHRDQGMH